MTTRLSFRGGGNNQSAPVAESGSAQADICGGVVLPASLLPRPDWADMMTLPFGRFRELKNTWSS